MGAGTNCQDRLIALHDLDCPWRPSDLIQRSGRIIRQGNKNPEVDIYRYVTEGTFDAYLYQLVENKQRFISQIMTSKTPVRFAEDIDETFSEPKSIASLSMHNHTKFNYLHIQHKTKNTGQAIGFTQSSYPALYCPPMRITKLSMRFFDRQK